MRGEGAFWANLRFFVVLWGVSCESRSSGLGHGLVRVVEWTIPAYCRWLERTVVARIGDEGGVASGSPRLCSCLDVQSDGGGARWTMVVY